MSVVTPSNCIALRDREKRVIGNSLPLTSDQFLCRKPCKFLHGRDFVILFHHL